MAVVREDVVKIGFDVDMTELTKATSGCEDIKKILGNGIGDDAFDEMIKEGKQANEELEGIKKTADGIKPDGIDKTAEGLGDAGKEAGKAHEKLKKIANTGFEKTVSGLKSIVSTLGKVGVAAGKLLAKGLVAGSAGIGAIIGQSVSSYADYEQLVGGVDTLFKDASGTVQKYASEAYKTAGLSANAYMENVTSFSASLIQGLGGDTAAAAEAAHMAMVDMADNANKMGTNISSIQDAYQGFAKDNYTMLDNLKLGYGGTQSEMARLINDTGVLGKKTKVTAETVKDVPFDKIIEAIHKVQENLGIAGTTLDEAEGTISGSLSALKAAWSNTLTSLVRGGDEFDRCVENLVKSAKTFGDNIMPALTKALEGVGMLIEELAPILEKELPGIIDALLPPMIRAAASLIKGIIKALPSIIGILIDELPGVLSQVWQGIKDAFGDIPGMEKIETFFGKLKEVFVNNADIVKKVAGVAVGLVAAFKLFNGLKGLTSIFGGESGGGKGGGLFGVFNKLAKMKPTVVLKGILNLAIILGGLALLGAALMAVAPYMAQLSDLKSTGEVLLVIGAVGLIGSGLASLSSVIGAIPIATVLAGLENIALALAGFTAIIVAFGALSKVEGFNDFLTSGGEVLSNLCRILGEMVGSIVGGLAEGITNSLPAIGANLSAFATSIQPMFDTFAGVDTSGLSDFAAAFAAFIAIIAGEKIVGLVTGGIDYADLGNKLSTMATSLSGFFTTVMTFPDGGFEKAKSLFDCLAGITSMPKEGGVVGWFQGEVDFASIASGIQLLAGAGMVTALTALSTIPETAYSSLTAMFDALAGIKTMPKEGGIAGWFSGDSSTGLKNVASQLPDIATHIASFFSNLGGRTDFSPIKNLFDTLSNIEISSDAAKGTGLFGTGASQLEMMGQGLADFALAASGFFAAINSLNLMNLIGFFTMLSTMGTLPAALLMLDITLGTMLTNIALTAQTKMTEIKDAIITGLTECVTQTNEMVPQFYDAGVAIMQGLENGMESMRSSLIEKARSIADAVRNELSSTLEIHSPSRVTFAMGEFVGQGMALGMKKSIPSVEHAAGDMSIASIPYSSNYSPDVDSSNAVYNNGGNSEYTTISPVFNLTISGSQDDRTLARKVKQYVAQAITETFESLERKNPVLREA